MLSYTYLDKIQQRLHPRLHFKLNIAAKDTECKELASKCTRPPVERLETLFPIRMYVKFNS